MSDIDFEHRLFNFRTTPSTACSYLAHRSARNLYLHVPSDVPFGARDIASRLLVSGFRRHRDIYYRPVCRDCRACLSVRIPVGDFDFNRRSVRRVLRRNRHLVFMESPAVADRELYGLFCRYMAERHGGSEVLCYDEFALLLEVGGELSCLYRAYDDCGNLIAVIFVDRHMGGYSAVHSFYSGCGLGTWLIYRLLSEAKDLGVGYVYLGYWIEGCGAMEYKGNFRPLEVYINGTWLAFSQVQSP